MASVALAPLRLWVPGPEPAPDSVVVSATDLSLARRRDTAGAMAGGLRLALGWYAMDGAVGLWLWWLPRQWRSGSVTVWATEGHLRRFVSLPAHRMIMRRYRDRGTLRSTTWRLDGDAGRHPFERALTWIHAPSDAR
jgi:hypothetical protein